MSVSADCLACTHVRKVVSDAISTQQEIVLNMIVPRHQRFALMAMSDRNVLQDVVLNFKLAEKHFKFDELLCLPCTKADIEQRLASLGSAPLYLSEDNYVDLDDETAFERVSASGWKLFEGMNKVVEWADPFESAIDSDSASRWDFE